MQSAFEKSGDSLPAKRLTTSTFHALALRHYQRHSRIPAKLISPAARSGMINGMLARLAFEQRTLFTLSLERHQGALFPEKLKFDSEIEDDVLDFIEQYHQRLQSINAIDLATVMRECVMSMRRGEFPLLPASHLIGDEMQDADEVQLELMLLHAKNDVTTTLVADDDQTIYEWRCALGYEGLMRFAKETGAKTITLAENFRSRSEIVAHAQALIQHNCPDRIDKNPTAVRGPGGMLGSCKSGHIDAECEKIAGAIAKHRIPGESVAILGRSNRDLDTMERYLMQPSKGTDDDAGPIAYRRDGQSIWQTPDVEALLCLLRAVIKGHTTDILPVLAILPVSPRTLTSLEKAIGPVCGDFLDGVIPPYRPEDDSETKAVEALSAATAHLRRKVRAGEVSFAVADAVIELRRLNREKASSPSSTKRSDALLTSAEAVLMNLKGPLSQRLNVIARMRERTSEENVVRLMTMHAAKGLEFDLVFLLNASHNDDGSALIADHAERRVFYVGMTRAKNRLVASYSDKPCKFIHEAGIAQHANMDELFGHAT